MFCTKFWGEREVDNQGEDRSHTTWTPKRLSGVQSFATMQKSLSHDKNRPWQ